jgi:hypothetical protein
VNDKDLRVYVVYLPILKSDVEGSVPEATKRLPDKRVSFYWNGDGELAWSYSRLMKLGEEQPAWDIYFVFDGDAAWKDKPPLPTYWMHQLRMAPERLLDGEKLAAEIKRLIKTRPVRKLRNR